MAIITDDFRKTSARHLQADINTTPYYIGVGKSDPWYDMDSDETGAGFDGIPGPVPSTIIAREALENLSFIARVPGTAAYPLVPRINLVADGVYKVYDQSDAACFEAESGLLPCYAMNSSRQLFVCLRNSTAANGVPSAMSQSDVDALVLSSTADPFAQSDSDEVNGIFNPNGGDYIWAYVCTVDNNSGFYTNDYIALENNDFTGDTAADSDTPAEVTGGMLYGFNVVQDGASYSASTSVIVTCRFADNSTLVLDSSDLADGITVNISDGAITSVTLDTNLIITSRIDKIVSASVHVEDTTGSGAIIAPLIAPPEGFGGDVVGFMPTYYTGITAQFPDTLLSSSVNDGIVGTDGEPYKFRQVSLIKGPVLITQADGIDYADCLRYFDGVTNITGGSLTYGSRVFQTSDSVANALAAGNPVAYIDHYDAETNRLYYHQNLNDLVSESRVNMAEFADDSDSAETEDGTSFDYTSLGTREYSPYTAVDASDAGFGAIKQNGKLLFLDNRAAVSRSANQTEEVRLVIQF